MINKLLDALAETLEKVNSEAEIYINEIKQDFEEPCFFIQLLNPNEKHLHNDRYSRNYDFVINYFSEGKDKKELFGMIEKLHNGLEIIGNNEFLGTDRHSEIQDGVLHYFVTYKCFVRKVVETDVMGNAKVDVVPRR